ncbi:hypothetical protein [Bradyrhizobium cenepequi]|uniref:hypothetical protein n=1 Tax=Bradyrhizobium cenepequi TaxID=2821403 RepID=UPI001CE248FE|nr:hypothetical protein [Bradyrhizobium cenepequi]MCA6109392.1 hypothetical protein [Bradyrhizobium cenepequi]
MQRVRKAVATPYAVPIGTGLLLTLCASANAATVHRSKPRHVQGFHYAVPSQPPFHYDDTPSYNDPSKFGGGTAL